MFSKLASENELHCGLDFSHGDGRSFGSDGKAFRLFDDSVENVKKDGVHDVNAFSGDAGVGVDLFQDIENVGRECSGVSVFLMRRSLLFFKVHREFGHKWVGDGIC